MSLRMTCSRCFAMERRYSNSFAVRRLLAARGLQIRLLEPFSFSVGQGAAVVRDRSRQVNFAAGDPRSDGAAIPQEPTAR